MAFTPSLLSDITAFALAYVLWRLLIKKSKNLPYPPGPKGIAFVGNLFDVPLDRQWLGYKRMSERYCV